MNRIMTGITAALLLVVCGCAGVGRTGVATSPTSVEGLWRHISITKPGGRAVPVAGVILFKDNVFLQQVIVDDGSPFAERLAMGNSGSFLITPDGADLVSDQTIGIRPTESPPLYFRRGQSNPVRINRVGDRLELAFGSGSVHAYERIGPGRGVVHRLKDGAFALVDKYFVLVSGDEHGAITGFGRFESNKGVYVLRTIQWAEASGAKSTYHRSIATTATFDGKALTLSDGRTLPVKMMKSAEQDE